MCVCIFSSVCLSIRVYMYCHCTISAPTSISACYSMYNVCVYVCVCVCIRRSYTYVRTYEHAYMHAQVPLDVKIGDAAECGDIEAVKKLIAVSIISSFAVLRHTFST